MQSNMKRRIVGICFTHISIIVSICRNDYSIKVQQFWQKFLRADSEWVPVCVGLETELNQILFIVVVFFWDSKFIALVSFIHCQVFRLENYNRRTSCAPFFPPYSNRQFCRKLTSQSLIVNQPSWTEMNRTASSNNCIALCFHRAFREENWLPIVILLPAAHTPLIPVKSL